VVTAPLALRNSITTSPSDSSSRMTGFVVSCCVGAGSATVVGSTVAAFAFTAVLLPDEFAATAEMVRSFGMASLIADACPRRFGAWECGTLHPLQLKPG